MSHSTVRLGNGSSMRFTELHCVNLSPENRFEASPLRGNPLPPGLSGVTLVCLCAMAAITPWYCRCSPGRHSPGGQSVSESSQPRHERRALCRFPTETANSDPPAPCRDQNSYSLIIPPNLSVGIELVHCDELLATSKMLLHSARSKSKPTGCRIKGSRRRCY